MPAIEPFRAARELDVCAISLKWLGSRGVDASWSSLLARVLHLFCLLVLELFQSNEDSSRYKLQDPKFSKELS